MHYSKTCFVRPLDFSTENSRKMQVGLQRIGKINIKSKELHKRPILSSDLTRQETVQNSDRK